MQPRTVRFSGHSFPQSAGKKAHHPKPPNSSWHDGQKRLRAEAYTRVATEQNTTNGLVCWSWLIASYSVP
jgi:hypothetical protein